MRQRSDYVNSKDHFEHHDAYERTRLKRIFKKLVKGCGLHSYGAGLDEQEAVVHEASVDQLSDCQFLRNEFGGTFKETNGLKFQAGRKARCPVWPT